MTTNATKIWNSGTTRQLAEVLTAIDDLQSMQNFLRDAMTEKEIVEIGARLEAAKLLTRGERYTDVIAKTNLSSRTVARISAWLKNGCKGYQIALQKIEAHHGHISPARAE